MHDTWGDWTFTDHRHGAASLSMRRLARYANPDQVRRLGLGLGGTQLGPETPLVTKARQLAGRLARTGLRYEMEPFNPRQQVWGAGQIVRTTPELLEGAGTCLDFTVSLAASCVREGVPVIMAYAMPTLTSESCHAFVLVQQNRSDGTAAGGSVVHTTVTFGECVAALEDAAADVENALIEATPLRDGGGSMSERHEATMKWLRDNEGIVHLVHVQEAVEGVGWYELPDAARDLGLTGWLPDLPVDHADYPARTALFEALSKARGRVVLVGERGTGKSTLALQLALHHGKGHGWYIDGSDRTTFRRSLAEAEARCRGHLVANDLSDTIDSLSAAAIARLTARDAKWVVVVDNADSAASVVPAFPLPRNEQLLIVTTTDQGWADGLGTEWRVEHLDRLSRGDLDEDERTLALDDEELLPGLLRIARNCDPGLLAATDACPAGAQRLVRAALGGLPAGVGLTPDTPVARAVIAASFMPAEQITLGWLTAALGGDRGATVAAVRGAQFAGLIEPSRFAWGRDADDDVVLWMHRLVRGAVRELVEDRGTRLALEVLARHRSRKGRERYDTDELAELVRVLRRATGTHPDTVVASATTAVLNLLEPRGSQDVVTAAELAAVALPDTDMSTLDGLETYCVGLMARARRVNQNSRATLAEVEEAIGWCQLAADACGDTDDRERVLLRGRADAMRGILLRKRARRRAGERIDHRAELQQAIDVLKQSYQLRRTALTTVHDNGAVSLDDDPDQHVDRGWYNLGGAYLALANLLVDEDRAALPGALTEALTAYVGSLSLRRAFATGETKYTTASLWGAALVLYTAALHCPGELGLVDLPPTPELNPVLHDQNAATLLRAAEVCVIQALQAWAWIDGPVGVDTTKARTLHRKISLAWLVADLPHADRPAAIRTGLDELLTDLRLNWKDFDDDSR